MTGDSDGKARELERYARKVQSLWPSNLPKTEEAWVKFSHLADEKGSFSRDE